MWHRVWKIGQMVSFQVKILKRHLIFPDSKCLKITQNVTFEFLQLKHFPPNFALLKMTCLVTPDFQKLAKTDHFWGIFNQLLSTQNVNVDVKCDFFYNFQTLWYCVFFWKKEMTETHWTSLPSLMTTFPPAFFTITKYCDSTVKKTPSSLVAPLYVISYQSLGVGRAVGSIMASSTILDSPSIMMMQY